MGSVLGELQDAEGKSRREDERSCRTISIVDNRGTQGFWFCRMSLATLWSYIHPVVLVE